MSHQTTRIISATLITLHETTQTRIPRLPLTTTWRRVSHLTQPLKLLQSHLAASSKVGLGSLGQLPGTANKMRQAALTSIAPGLIHAVAVADQSASPILCQRLKGRLRTLGMNTAQGHCVRHHAPEPLQGMAAVPRRLIDVAHRRLAGQASNRRIVRHDGQGGAVNEALNRTQTDRHPQHRTTKVLHATPGGAVHGAELTCQCRQTWAIAALSSLGQPGFEPLATTRTLALVQDPVRDVHQGGWQFHDLMGVIRRRQTRHALTTNAGFRIDGLPLGGTV